jgi:putative spermidine/putrescine transport system substrate-binding protein
VAVAATTAFSLAACSSGSGGGGQVPASATQTITYVSYGGDLQTAETKAWLEPFMKAHPNIKINYDITDYAKLKAMVESGKVTWDVFTSGNDFGLGQYEQYLTKLDCSVIPCSELQPNRYLTTGYRVAQTTSGLALGYNKSKMPAGQIPQNWADFFNTTKFPGKRVMMYDTSSFPFEIALLADGVPQNKLYPIDYARAIKKLNSISNDLIIAPSYQGCGDMVGSGEAVMGGCWTGRLQDQIDAGKPVGIQWNQNMLSPGYYSIPKGSTHVAAAEELIAYITSASHNGALANFIPYGPANAGALSTIPPATRANLQTSYINEGVSTDDQWLIANAASYTQQWTAWKSGM